MRLKVLSFWHVFLVGHLKFDIYFLVHVNFSKKNSVGI